MQSNVPRQLLYGTMVYVRQTIVADASCALSRAVCIATRYSAVRRQFGSKNGGPETQVLPLNPFLFNIIEKYFNVWAATFYMLAINKFSGDWACVI